MPLDLDFFSDPGVQLLYEENTADEADAAVVLFIRMLIRAHRLDRPDVRSEFTQSKNQRRHDTLARLANAGLIDTAGIKVASWKVWRTPDRGAYTPERQAPGGLARAATAIRDGGKFASVEPALTSVDEPSVGGTERSGTGRNGFTPSLQEEETNDLDSRSDKSGLPEHFADVALLLRDLTQVDNALRDPWGKMWEQIAEQIRAYGYGVVTDRMRLVASRVEGGHPTVSEIVFNTGSSLRRKVETEDVRAVEKVESDEADIARRIERTQIRVHEGGGHADPSQFKKCPKCRDVTPGLDPAVLTH